LSDHSYNALYYPFIHFKDDRWLKLSALYWDRMGRIVPRAYKTEDSETVRALGDFVETLRPEWVRPDFAGTFIEFVGERGSNLQQHYGVAKKDGWPEIPLSLSPPTAGGLSGSDPRLSYIFEEKITPELVNTFVHAGLAEPDPGDRRWLGMHPKVAQVYMTALADQLAGERGLYPVTDETVDHLAMGGWTVERIGQALLPDVPGVPEEPSLREVETVAVSVALQTIIPKDISSVPVNNILRFRDKYPDERAAFQKYIADFLNVRQWLTHLEEPGVLAARIQQEYAKDLKPKLEDYRAKLHDTNIATIYGALAVQISVPAVIAQGAALLGVAANPIAAFGAGAALGAIPVLRDRRKIQRELKTAPVAYLVRVEEDLEPSTLLQWIRNAAEKFGIRRIRAPRDSGS
jgi:hypothetical protein